MPVLPNAKKAMRSSRKKKKVNDRLRSNMKQALKRLQQEPTEKNLQAAQSAIDKAVKKGVVHKNKAARKKSQAAQILAAASA